MSKRYGVIIGVSDYGDVDGASDLQYTANDAIRLYRALLSVGDFSEDTLSLFCEVSEDNPLQSRRPTRSDILDAVKYAADAAAEEDLILLYFAGHGLELQEQAYLLTNDTRMNVVEHTALPVVAVNDILQGARAKCVVRFFDACRGAYGEGRLLASQMRSVLEKELLRTGTGWAAFSACSSGEIAREDGDLQHGVFTHYLCQGLERAAVNDSGSVTLERLIDYVKTSVRNWCDQHRMKQTPQFVSELAGELELTKPSSPRPEGTGPEEAGREGDPLAQLSHALDEHLMTVPDDVRGMKITTSEEGDQVSELVLSELSRQLVNLATEVLQVGDIRTYELLRLNHYGALVRQTLDQWSVRQELAQPPGAWVVSLQSSYVTIPSSDLVVSVVRFSFFYWICFALRCMVPELQERWTPDPPCVVGQITFDPRAAVSVEKVSHHGVREVLARCSESIMAWSKQLTEFVEQKIQPLRNSGPIVR